MIVPPVAATRGFAGQRKKGGIHVASVHYKISIIGRSGGRSSVAAAAYRAAEKIYNHRDGIIYDFTRKRGVAHSEVLLPEHAPRDFADRAILWNAVEHAERQKNAQLSRQIEIGLPAEIDREAQINLTRDYVQKQFVDRGMCADICVHDKRDGNPHAHVMLTMRPIEPDGTWGAKSKKEYILDKQGQKIMLPSGNWKSKHVPSMNWDSRENAEQWRTEWAHAVNREYERLGLEPRIDLRNYERQGLEIEPTRHLGPQAAALEKQGIPTEIGEHNRAVEARNALQERGRHVRNLEAKHFSQRPQREAQAKDRLPSYDEWLAGHKEQSRGMERGR